MPFDEKTLEKLGCDMAKNLGDGSSNDRLEFQEELFVSIVKNGGRVEKRRSVFYIMAAAAVLIIGLSVALFVPEKNQIQFRVGQDSSAGSIGQWLQTSHNKNLAVNFDGGSTYELYSGASARVLRSDTEVVELDLSKGTLRASIVGNGSTQWAMHAGPYKVTVLGTEFEVSWKDEKRLLNVNVIKGCVLVQSDQIGEHGIKVFAGNHLEAGGEHGKVVLNPKKDMERVEAEKTGDLDQQKLAKSDQEAKPESKAAYETGSVSDSHREVRRKNGEYTGRKGNEESLSWLNLYETSDCEGALEVAGKTGIEKICKTADVENLWKLADAARSCGQFNVSYQALTAYRQRFSQSKKAKTAAFMLGRMSLEQKHDAIASTKWFRTYLEEAPAGPLAQEAQGRLIDACRNTGLKNEARREALKYLEKYPEGSYAALARSVLGN